MNYEVNFRLSLENQHWHSCEKRLESPLFLLRNWILTSFLPLGAQVICFPKAGIDLPSTFLIFFFSQAVPMTLKLWWMHQWCFHIPDGIRDHTFPVREARLVVVLFPSYRLTSKLSKPRAHGHTATKHQSQDSVDFCAPSPLTTLNTLKFSQVDSLPGLLLSILRATNKCTSHDALPPSPLQTQRMHNRKWMWHAQCAWFLLWHFGFASGEAFPQLQTSQRCPHPFPISDISQQRGRDQFLHLQLRKLSLRGLK